MKFAILVSANHVELLLGNLYRVVVEQTRFFHRIHVEHRHHFVLIHAKNRIQIASIFAYQHAILVHVPHVQF